MGCPGCSPGTGGQVGGQDEELEEAEQPQQLQTPQALCSHTCTAKARESRFCSVCLGSHSGSEITDLEAALSQGT